MTTRRSVLVGAAALLAAPVAAHAANASVEHTVVKKFFYYTAAEGDSTGFYIKSADLVATQDRNELVKHIAENADAIRVYRHFDIYRAANDISYLSKFFTPKRFVIEEFRIKPNEIVVFYQGHPFTNKDGGERIFDGAILKMQDSADSPEWYALNPQWKLHTRKLVLDEAMYV